MDSRVGIAAGIVAGFVAGALLVGTAFGLARAVTTGAPGGFAMMPSYVASSVSDRRTAADMYSFMDGYRTERGGIDIDRMHEDIASGRVTPPCLDGGPNDGVRGVTPRDGWGMMRGRPGDTSGWGMMGPRF